MSKTIKNIEEYTKQYDNLMEKAGKSLSYSDLIKLIIEARVSRDMFRKEKNHYQNRFREIRNNANQLKITLKKSIKGLDTRILNKETNN